MRNKKVFVPIVIFITIVIAISSIAYRNTNDIGEEEYKELFYKNKDVLTNLSNELIMIEEDLYIIKESGVLVVRSNGINVELTDYSTGAEIKEAIGNVMKTLDIRRIYKDDSFVEFIYHRKFDRYRIIYSTDNERMEAYTRMEELGEDWYFGHVLQE